MKIKFTVIAVFLFPLFVQAQFEIGRPPLSADSLKKVLPLLHDSARVDCLSELARYYSDKVTLAYTDSALEKLNQAYKEAFAIRYIKGLGDACIQYGMIYTWLVPNYRECEKYYREAISWHKKIQNNNGLGFGFRGLGIILFNQGSIDEAMKAFEQSAFHFKRTDNAVMLADLIDWFGTVYGAKGDFEKQFESIKKGLREKRRIHNSRGIVWSFYRLAYIHVGIEDYETALGYFRQSLQQAKKESIPWQIYRSMGRIFLYKGTYDSSMYYFRKMLQINPYDGPALGGLGELFMRKKEYHKALDYLLNALISFKKSIDLGGEIWVVAHIGKTYAGTKDYEKALTYARECLAMARQSDNKQVMQYAYEIHWNVYEALQQKDSAYFYYKQFATLKDSLDHAKFKRQHLQKLALYKVESKEEEQQARIDLLNKDNQLKQQQLQDEALMKKILIACLIVFILAGIIIFRNIILKRRNEKLRLENELKEQQLASERKQAELQKQTSELEMQALRAQMNPHFIFNCLNSINRFILKNETEAASDYLTKFSRLIRMVLNNSKHKYIPLNEELDCLELYIQLEQLRFKNSFGYKIKCAADIDAEELLVPPMLLQPFIENAIWHGLMHLPHRQAGKECNQGHLEIFVQQKDEIIEYTITDNGIGRKAAFELSSKSTAKYKSLGLQITTERIALLDKERGEHFIEIKDLYDGNGNANGTKVLLRIKYNVPAEKVFL
jgi:tetratricopeptide (TPR) repeat protein